VCRVQWKQAANASRGADGGGDAGGRESAGGEVSGDGVATNCPREGVGGETARGDSVELPGIQLSGPAAQAAAAAPAIDSATVAKMVSEALFALELDIGAGAPPGVPAAEEPAAAVAAALAKEPAAAERERPELTDEPAAAPREYWVLNSAVDPKVILKKAFSGRRQRRQRPPPQGQSGKESLCQGRGSPRRPGGRHVRHQTHQ
jgi:hypothetical protein